MGDWRWQEACFSGAEVIEIIMVLKMESWDGHDDVIIVGDGRFDSTILEIQFVIRENPSAEFMFASASSLKLTGMKFLMRYFLEEMEL
jgi:hypothetical protein